MQRCCHFRWRALHQLNHRSYSQSLYRRNMIEALPFKLNTEEAVDSFETWAKEKTPVLVAPPLLSLTPYYLPFWVFQTTVRTTHAGGVVEDATPRPSLQCYAGHTFRRSVTSVLKTQVAEAVPFRTDMLNGVGAHVELDARALFESTAWSLVKEAVLAEEIERFGAGCTCVFGTVKSRQVLLPCFIAQYQVFGQTFRAYINGTTGEGFSLQQTIFPAPQFAEARKKVLFLVPLAPLLARFLLYPPALLVSTISFLVLRYMHRSALIHSQRESWVAWHEQREKELQMQRGKTDSWSYSSKQQTASGGTRASATAHASAAGPDSARTTKRIPYVNPADYYALLGLSEKRHLATLDEIRSAFRRQLMQFHPDRCEAEGYDKDEASARTRELYDAFAVLRDPVKRAAFDRKAAW